MNNEEIKEILSLLNSSSWSNEAKTLENYITNLQQRCEYLERSNNRREDTILGLRQEIYEQEDYKSRCEKASRTLETLKGSARWERHLYEVDYLLNILQNGSDG